MELSTAIENQCPRLPHSVFVDTQGFAFPLKLKLEKDGQPRNYFLYAIIRSAGEKYEAFIRTRTGWCLFADLDVIEWDKTPTTNDPNNALIVYVRENATNPYDYLRPTSARL